MPLSAPVKFGYITDNSAKPYVNGVYHKAKNSLKTFFTRLSHLGVKQASNFQTLLRTSLQHDYFEYALNTTQAHYREFEDLYRDALGS